VSWNYLQSIQSDANTEWRASLEARFGSHVVSSDPMEAATLVCLSIVYFLYYYESADDVRTIIIVG
jgi:hypothetical protein